MKLKYQVTFFAEKYRPVAAIVEAESKEEVRKEKWKEAAVTVCAKRGWTYKEMIGYGYKTFKVRVQGLED